MARTNDMSLQKWKPQNKDHTIGIIPYLVDVFIKKEYKSKLIGQMHDSILVDLHPNEKTEIFTLLKKTFEDHEAKHLLKRRRKNG